MPARLFLWAIMAVTTFTTEAAVQRLLSSQAVTDFADHDEDGAADTGVVTDCIEQASEELSMYAGRFYADANLATSSLVTRWATTIAAFFLCQRRGNPVPDSLAAEFARLTEEPDGLLLRIANGKLQLPGVAMRDGVTPQFSNLEVDQRHARDTVRVTGTGSVDKGSLIEQHKSYSRPEAW